MSKRPERFFINVCWHHFAFGTRLMIFFYRPCNFHFNILSSFESIAKTLSVALEVSLSICLAKLIYYIVTSTLDMAELLLKVYNKEN